MITLVSLHLNYANVRLNWMCKFTKERAQGQRIYIQIFFISCMMSLSHRLSNFIAKQQIEYLACYRVAADDFAAVFLSHFFHSKTFFQMSYDLIIR